MKPVYVIGHKNPDVDSIASAIGYAAFKTAIEPGRFVPAAAGLLNSESRFVLTHLGIDEPFQLLQVGTVAQDLLAEGEPMGISPEMDLHTLGDLMRQKSLKSARGGSDGRISWPGHHRGFGLDIFRSPRQSPAFSYT